MSTKKHQGGGGFFKVMWGEGKGGGG